MKTIKHSLKFITELDETDPTAQRLLTLPKDQQVLLLESLLKELIAPKITPILDEVNAGNSWANLKVAK